MSGTTSIAGTNGSAAAAATSAAAQKKSASFGADFDSFLTLLTAQLKNQDPTKAMDTTEMTNQLVAFAGVEQQLKMNDQLESLIALQQASELSAAAPLLGRTVEAQSDRIALQDGKASIRLPAAGRATEAVVTIADQSNRALREVTVALKAEPFDWTWDGRDQTGAALKDGAYRLNVAGRSVSGTAAPVTASVLGRVTGLEREGNSGLSLVLGGVTLGFDKVRAVRPQ